MADATLDLATVWDQIRERLATSLSPQQNAMLNLTRPLGLVEDTAVLAAPNEFTQTVLESRMRRVLAEALSEQFGRDIRVAVQLEDAPAEPPADDARRGADPPSVVGHAPRRSAPRRTGPAATAPTTAAAPSACRTDAVGSAAVGPATPAAERPAGAPTPDCAPSRPPARRRPRRPRGLGAPRPGPAPAERRPRRGGPARPSADVLPFDLDAPGAGERVGERPPAARGGAAGGRAVRRPPSGRAWTRA